MITMSDVKASVVDYYLTREYRTDGSFDCADEQSLDDVRDIVNEMMRVCDFDWRDALWD